MVKELRKSMKDNGLKSSYTLRSTEAITAMLYYLLTGNLYLNQL